MNHLLRGALVAAGCAGAYLILKQLLQEDSVKRWGANSTDCEESVAKKNKATMGCWQSKQDAAPEQSIEQNSKATTSAPAGTNSTSDAAPKKKLDIKDFQFMKCTDQVLIKEPGSINGQIFNIGDCENCDIYICDYIAQVQIDCCKNCRIFVGPTEASIFFRNCEGCKCIFACRQYRARECVDCDTLLFASTAPVVESSKNMRFGCFRFFYFNLAQQMEAVKLSVFDNKWSEIYDFTPGDGNWSFLPLETKASDLMKPLSQVSTVTTKEEEETHGETAVVPVTVGLRGKEFAGLPRAFLLLLPNKFEEGLKVLGEVAGKGLAIIQTKELLLDPSKAKELFQKAKAAGLGGQLANKTVVGCEVAGSDVLALCQHAVQDAGGEGVAYVSASEEGAVYESNLFFEQWRDFAGSSITK